MRHTLAAIRRFLTDQLRSRLTVAAFRHDKDAKIHISRGHLRMATEYENQLVDGAQNRQCFTPKLNT
jgi:hypothetical protein